MLSIGCACVGVSPVMLHHVCLAAQNKFLHGRLVIVFIVVVGGGVGCHGDGVGGG